MAKGDEMHDKDPDWSDIDLSPARERELTDEDFCIGCNSLLTSYSRFDPQLNICVICASESEDNYGR